MSIHIRQLLLACLGGIACLPAMAGEDGNARLALDDEDVMLDTVKVVEVITGTRTAKPEDASPVKVEVVSQEVIGKRHSGDLAEAMEVVPGIQIREIHGKEGNEAWIQGISANRVLVLVDGEPVSASTGSSVDLTQIAVTEVEQVEVVKGAVSALYGSSAMGGVINLVTARPQPGWHARVMADAGSYGGQNPDGDSASLTQSRLQTGLSYGGQMLSLAAGASARFSEGFQVDPDGWSQQGPDGHKINAYLSGTVSPTEGSTYAIRHEAYDQQQHNRITALLPPPNDRKHKQDDAERYHTALKGNWSLDDDVIKANIHHEQYRNTSSPDGSFDRIATFDTQKASVQWDNDKLESQIWTMGAELFSESFEQEKILADGTVTNEVDACQSVHRDRVEMYAQDDIALGDLNLLPGLRVQSDSEFGTHWTPKLNLRQDLFSYNGSSLFLRAGAGAGYRVPNLKERCYVFDHSHLGYKVIGNEYLEPEQSASYQLGLTYLHDDYLRMEANLFRNDLKNLIDIVYSHHEGMVSVSQYQNIARANTGGIELDLMYAFSHGWNLRTGYVWLRAIDEQQHERLKDRAEHQIKLQLDYSNASGTGVNLLTTWQSDEYDAAQDSHSPAWQRYDLKINQAISAAWSVYGGVNNITNKQRKFDGSYDNRPVEGRLVYAGFRFDY